MQKKFILLALMSIIPMLLMAMAYPHKADTQELLKPIGYASPTVTAGFPPISSENVTRLTQITSFNVSIDANVDWLDEKSLIIWHSQGVQLIEITNFNPMTIMIYAFPATTGTLSTFSVRPDGKGFVWGTDEGDLAIWTVAEQSYVEMPIPSSVMRVIFTPDMRFLASGHDDGITILWDVETQAEVVRLRFICDRYCLYPR